LCQVILLKEGDLTQQSIPLSVSHFKETTVALQQVIHLWLGVLIPKGTQCGPLFLSCFPHSFFIFCLSPLSSTISPFHYFLCNFFINLILSFLFSPSFPFLFPHLLLPYKPFFVETKIMPFNMNMFPG
jgi:hypothetical protein